MGEIRLKQVRSPNGASRRQLETLRALRLGRIGRESSVADTPQARGMVAKVAHLVEEVGS